MMNSATSETTETTTVEKTAIKLRQAGATYAKIREATGLTDRQVKKLVKGIPKATRSRRATPRMESPFIKSTKRVLPLAMRHQGIRDHELRDILHEEYGSTWNTSTGRYDSNYTADHLKRIKERVREQASESSCNAMFLPDWIDDNNARASSDFLISAATDLMSRVDEHVNDYMATHGTPQEPDCEQGLLARRKQCYAVRQHLLKLAVRGYGQEPIEKLLDRTANLVGKLEGNPDIQVTEGTQRTETQVPTEPIRYYPEPSRRDAFLDFVEAQGWIKA